MHQSKGEPAKNHLDNGEWVQLPLLPLSMTVGQPKCLKVFSADLKPNRRDVSI